MTLPRSTPSAQGMDAAGLTAFLRAADAAGLDLHSLMVARHGHVVAEGWWGPYDADAPTLVYSLSKTVTATAVAFLVQEGRVALDDIVLDFFPDLDRDGLAPLWTKVAVRHCLSMTVGHESDAWEQVWDRSNPAAKVAGDDWLPRVFAIAPTTEPGTVFAYNQVATYLLSRIVAQVTGEGIAATLAPRLLGRLGVDGIPWHTDPLGHELGFSGAHLTTETILSLAQLHLDRGRWEGEQLLEPSWFDEATVAFGPLDPRPETEADWARGYGYSFWMQEVGYRGDGAYGQFLVVLPEQDVAIAITSEQERMQSTLDLLWRHVVPAVGAEGSPDADAELAAVLEAVRMPVRSAVVDGPAAATFARRPASDQGSELAGAFSAVTVRREPTGLVLGLTRDGTEGAGDATVLEVRVGSGEWAASTLEAEGLALPVLASGGWVDDSTFVAVVLVIETPHRFHVEARLGAPTAQDEPGEVAMTWRLVPLMGRDPFGLAVRRA